MVYVDERLKHFHTLDSLRDLKDNDNPSQNEEDVIHRILDQMYNLGTLDETNYWRLKENPREAMNYAGVAIPVKKTVEMTSKLRKKGIEQAQSFMN